MSKHAENLQDAIGLIRDEYVLEAHGETDSPNESTQAPQAAKVVKMPAQRKRKATVPIAIAACLVLVIGVGALAISGMFSSPQAVMEDVSVETADDRYEKEAASPTLIASEADAGGTDAYTVEGGLAAGAIATSPPGNPIVPPTGDAFVLTAAEWNDNDNWPFFVNLVNSGAIAFPSFGIDPTHRVKVTVTDLAGQPLRNQAVVLVGAGGELLWSAVSGKDGAAYLFYQDGQMPDSVIASGVEQSLLVSEVPEGGQGEPVVHAVDDVMVAVDAAQPAAADLQVMFIVDTTGSMSDEIAYLQKDFASIAGDVGSDGVTYSVNFYRDAGDDYVTKCNGFTDDIPTVQGLLNNEYADGGGDTPEAVADILAETITANGDWRDDCNKVAFLIFDAPPHYGTEDVLDAAVRNAASRGIRIVPVVASNADRETELFGRALAICTEGTYVFLTDDSGVGDSHLEPIVGDYTVELLHDVIVRIIQESR